MIDKNIKLKKIDLADVTRIKPRTILDWTQRGYLPPVQKASGRGKISYYDATNAVQAKVLDLCSKGGISLSWFSEAFKELHLRIGFAQPFNPFNVREDEMYNLIILVDENKRQKVFYDAYGLKMPKKILNQNFLNKEEVIGGKYEYILIINLKKIMLKIKKSLEKFEKENRAKKRL